MKDHVFHLAKRLLLLLLLTAAAGCLIAQEESVDLNLLRAPVSPAATLLGTSESQVEKPSDPSAFMISLMQATDRLSAFPLNYAVDLAPVWLFRGDKITIDDYLSAKTGRSLPQSFVISLATANAVDSLGESLPRLAAGMKASILRGRVSDETIRNIDRLHVLLATSVIRFDAVYDSLLQGDDRYLSLDSLRRSIMSDSSVEFAVRQERAAPYLVMMHQIESDLEQEVREMVAGDEEELRRAIEELRIERFGPKLDVAMAASWDFPGGSMSAGGLSQFSLWLTGGYESPNGLSILALVRYMYFRTLSVVPAGMEDPEDYFENISALDGGLRLLYSYRKFMISVEALGRQFMGEPEEGIGVEQGWRGTFTASYEVGRNKKIGITVGRDFNQNKYLDEENLILGLNLLMGFGNRKQL